MDLRDYFSKTTGRGVLSTADAEGRVNGALFAKPHFMEDGSIAFIMPDRLTHRNLLDNPRAAYLFMEDGPGYRGLRLHLIKLREEKDSERLYSLRRRKTPAEQPRYLVVFKVEKELPLVGSGEGPEDE